MPTWLSRFVPALPRWLLLLCLAFSCAPRPARAADPKADAKAKPAGKAGAQPAKKKVTSKDVRKKKKVVAAMRAGYLGGIFSFGAEADFMPVSRAQYGALFMFGDLDLAPAIKHDESVVINEAVVKGNLMMLQGRFFFGNSLHASAGLGMRKFGFSIDIQDSTGLGRVKIEGEASGLAAFASIGNTWAWKAGYFVGMDWIGWGQPLTKNYTSSVATEGLANGALAQVQVIAEDQAKQLAATPTPAFLILNAGWMF